MTQCEKCGYRIDNPNVKIIDCNEEEGHALEYTTQAQPLVRDDSSGRPTYRVAVPTCVKI